MLKRLYSFCCSQYSIVKSELAITPAALHWIVRDRLCRKNNKHLSDVEIRQTRTSDTIFIFGSGSSIQDLSVADWAHFAKHNTMSFNYFMKQKKVRIDYHLIREIGLDDIKPAAWIASLKKYVELIQVNPFYRNTIIMLQHGWRGVNGNRFIGMGLFSENRRVFRYKNIYARHRTIFRHPRI